MQTYSTYASRGGMKRRALAGCGWLTAGMAVLATAGAAHADALGAPSMTAPLSANATPASFDAGPLGKVFVSGQITAMGLGQSDRVPNPIPGAGNADSLLDLSNGQVEIQTTSGPFQFFLEAGAYSFPTLGTPYIRAGKNTETFFSPLPVAYGKYQMTPEISFQAGSLPTLIGSEYAFTFQNMNIERGLLWNQEPVISKGVQANYSKGPLNVSVSVNDGFYSDRYNWVTGLASYAINGSNTIAVNGGVNFSPTFSTKFRTPVALSNSGIFDVSYTYSAGPLLINPYFQYTKVDTSPNVGITKDAYTVSGAVLAKYSFTPTVALAGRVEYISSHSSSCTAADGAGCAPTNLLYGPSSDAFSVTVTPTYQKGIFFARAEASYTRLEHATSGFGFGLSGNSQDQFRGLVETGLLF